MDIEAAAKAMYETWRPKGSWDTLVQREGGVVAERFRAYARAALPHLATWEEPTAEEIDKACDRAVFLSNAKVATLSLVETSLVEFVRRRNNKLKPPVDKHREALRTAIRKVLIDLMDSGEPDGRFPHLPDRILSAIDSVAAE